MACSRCKRYCTQNEKSPLFIASFADTRLDDVAEVPVRVLPVMILRVSALLWRTKIDSSAPAVSHGLSDEQSSVG
jgi:hypothetical protein